MAKYGIANIGGGGGIGSDELSSTKEYVLSGKTYVGADTNDEMGTGIMIDNGTTGNQSLNAGSSFKVGRGYHAQDFTVNANSLASQTSATASAGHILSGQTSWVNGNKITGNIASMGGQTVNPTASQQIVSTNGKYLTGNVTVNGVSNLTAANIKKGVTVGGTLGTFQGYVATATDLYLRGNNIVGLTVNSNYESLDSGQLTVEVDTTHTAIVSMTTNLTGFTMLNIEGYKSNTAAGNMYLLYGGSQVAQILSIPTGNYSVYFNVANFQVSGTFQIQVTTMKGSIYRIWKS